MSIAPSSLDSKALATRLRELAGDRRNVDVDFILHLDEFDRRRAYLEAGYGSLWAYCMEALHLCEGSAGRRIQAMKVLRRFPSLEGALRDGRLSISTIALLGQVATPDNVEDLLARTAYKSRADVDHLVASLQPRPAPRDGIRKLPERQSESLASPPPEHSTSDAPTTGLTPPDPEIPSPAVAVDATPSASVPVFQLAALPSARPSRPELRPVSGSEWSLRVTLDDACKADLETLRDLLSHKIPDGDLAAVLREAIRCAIDRHGKRRGTVAPSPKRAAKAQPAPVDPTATVTPPPQAAAPSEGAAPELFPRTGTSLPSHRSGPPRGLRPRRLLVRLDRRGRPPLRQHLAARARSRAVRRARRWGDRRGAPSALQAPQHASRRAGFRARVHGAVPAEPRHRHGVSRRCHDGWPPRSELSECGHDCRVDGATVTEEQCLESPSRVPARCTS